MKEDDKLLTNDFEQFIIGNVMDEESGACQRGEV